MFVVDLFHSLPVVILKLTNGKLLVFFDRGNLSILMLLSSVKGVFLFLLQSEKFMLVLFNYLALFSIESFG